MFLETDQEQQRSNPRIFGEKVSCFDYTFSDKLSSPSHEGRIIGYTHTHGAYQVLDQKGSIKLSKQPKPIQEEDEEVIVDPTEYQMFEQEEATISKPPQDHTTETSIAPPPAL